jgi:hypothetical protein
MNSRQHGGFPRKYGVSNDQLGAKAHHSEIGTSISVPKE